MFFTWPAALGKMDAASTSFFFPSKNGEILANLMRVALHFELKCLQDGGRLLVNPFGDITGVSQWQHAKWSSRDVAIFGQNGLNQFHT
jgi:hypothetical protein